MANVGRDLASDIAGIKKATVIRSFCYQCPWNCPTEVYVRDGSVIYVKGNQNAPNNPGGTRCAKGMSSPHITRDPDRLKYPLRRSGPRGSGRFERITWDEAFSTIAEKLTQLKADHGPESVVYYYHHDPNSVFAQILLTQLYGSPNFYGHTAGCEMDRRTATLALFGHPFPVLDFSSTRYAMLWGINLFEANECLYFNHALIRAIERGCKLVVVDPNFTQTAEKAQEWVPIKPGTDSALALALCRVIIDDELHDPEFVSTACSGFEGFREHLRDKGYTPAWAEGITGIPAETIVRLAREFATTKPAIAEVFKGPGYYTNGTDASRAIYLLDAITGNVGNPGTVILKEWAPLGHPVIVPEEEMAVPEKPPLHFAMGYPVAPDLPTGLLPKAVLEGFGYPIKCVFVQCTNPVMSDPNPRRIQEMFRNLDFSVAIDVYLSETALECDLVLPEASMYERAEVRQGLWLGPQAILCQPCVPPVGESKPLYDIVKGIAQKMGWGDYFNFEKWEDWAETSVQGLPISLEELKEKGFWAGEVRYGQPEEGYPTPSGKIEIYSEVFAANGFDPYPVYTEHSVYPDEEYPLQLTSSKLSAHVNLNTQNNPYLMEIQGENWVEINPVDASKYGVRDAAYVVLESPLSSITIKAKVSEGIRPGVVSVRHGHGFGHWAMGSVAKGKGAHSNALVEIHVNPISGGNAYNECKVRVSPA
ncbi:MAG: molybdopterin-dependent oxidoreductase [Deltaproteobacteria bacterium]|nr:molybdopterin-dependent oxidoreductase [Deltaproteobacteria bacterium]